MPKNASNRRCYQVFKRLIQHRHRSCEMTRDGSNVLGWRLKSCFNIESLDDDREYEVCRYINNIIRNAKHVPRQLKRVDSTVKLMTDVNVDDVYSARQRRLSHRRKVNQIPFDVAKLKRVIVVTNDNKEDEVFKFRRRNHDDVYTSDILESASEYKFSYSKLKLRTRRSRMETIAKTILSCCIKKSLMKNDPTGYLNGNK